MGLVVLILTHFFSLYFANKSCVNTFYINADIAMSENLFRSPSNIMAINTPDESYLSLNLVKATHRKSRKSVINHIRITCPCNKYPLKPHFYLVKMGFAGIHLFFLFLVQNRLWVLVSSHNVCFGAKIRKIDIPLHTPVLPYKSGFKGIFIARTCFSDAKHCIVKLV